MYKNAHRQAYYTSASAMLSARPPRIPRWHVPVFCGGRGFVIRPQVLDDVVGTAQVRKHYAPGKDVTTGGSSVM